MSTTPHWKLQLPACHGTYMFSGKLYITHTIYTKLSQTELMQIIHEVRTHVQQHNGTDYLLVFTNPSGQKIFCIDQLDQEMKQQSTFLPEDDHWTIMYAHEY